MYTLIVDSSTKVLYEALLKNDEVICERYVDGQNDHAKNIVKIVEDMYCAAGITARDVTKVVCGIGPGSYTGVRMAVTLAKMMGVFMKCDVYKISTLQLMASGTKGKALCAIDARRGNSFSARFVDGEYTDSEAVRNTNDYISEYADHKVLTEKEFTVDPVKVISLAKLHKNAHSLEPNYLQETEAERNLKNGN